MTAQGTDPRAGTFRGAWRHKRWRWMFAGYGVSLTGDFVYSVALVVYVLDRTGSAAWVSAAAVARLAPYLVLGPVGGVIADRVDRRKVLVVFDIVRAVLLGAMAAVAALDGPVIAVLVLAALAAAASVPYRAAGVAATPHLVGEEDLAAANAAESIVSQASWFVGPAIGAAVVALFGVGWALVLDAATFVAAAAMVARTGDLGGGTGGTGNGGDGGSDDAEEETESVWAGINAGVAVIRGDAGLAALTVFVCVLMAGFGMEQVLHVLVAVDRLHLDAEWVGAMGAAIGIGGLVVAPVTARLARGPHAGTALVISGVLSGLPLAALGLTSSKEVVLAILAVEGAAVIVNEVMLMTLLQRATPDEMLGRIFGLYDSSTALTQLGGSLIVPALVAGVGLPWTLAVGGGITVAASLGLAPALVSLGARAERKRQALAPLVDELRRFAILAELGEAALERIARSSVVESLDPGLVVMAEGDPPDDLYLVRAGELVVRSAGEAGGEVREVNRMVAGDWFGEIGLLQRRPRTATVEAVGAVELLRVPGSVFLDAVATPEVLADPVRRTMSVRLARTHPVVVGGS